MKLGYLMLLFVALIVMVSCAAPTPTPAPEPSPPSAGSSVRGEPTAPSETPPSEGEVEEEIEEEVVQAELLSYREFLPREIADLPEDFYPAGLTREKILKRLPEAVKKTGDLAKFSKEEIWSGVILVTGDIRAENLIIEPGTIVFIEANKDDQGWGEKNTLDPVNPHHFLGEDYSQNHIRISINERLTAKGTPDRPIIFTSTAEDPGPADWDHLEINKGVLEYVLVESCWGVSLDSSDATVSHSVIRNVLQQGLMFGRWEESGIYGSGPVSPTIKYNYIYNYGHQAIQSFFSDPYIAHNIFIQKNTNDPELYDYIMQGENGALMIFGDKARVEHNFLSCGYNPELENEDPWSCGPVGCACFGVSIAEATTPEIKFNTIVGSMGGIELLGGLPVVNYNNIHDNKEENLKILSEYSEPGRGDIPLAYGEIINFKNNWWGTPDRDEVMDKIGIHPEGVEGIEIDIDPISTSEIANAGPDWSEFEWLYK